MNVQTLTVMLALLIAAISAPAGGEEKAEADQGPLTMVVMDPLAAPLSCPCVEGYAQRKYEALGEHLESQLGRPVKVVFNEALGKALAGDAKGQADLVVGKDSVVRADAKAAELNLTAVGRLTDKKGSVLQHGLIVVPAKDPAKAVADLQGYDIIFGPAESDEKHKAAIEVLTKAGVKVPDELSIDSACSEGAAKVVDRGPGGKSAAVISSYAAPLLEGCGTIEKGDLRVLAKTEPVPFVTAFVNDELPAETQAELQLALFSMANKPELCTALESLVGFLPVAAEDDSAKKK